MTIGAAPVCITCQHLDFTGPKGKTCSAFVDIPDEIWFGGMKHDTPLPGQLDPTVVYKKGEPKQ